MCESGCRSSPADDPLAMLDGRRTPSRSTPGRSDGSSSPSATADWSRRRTRSAERSRHGGQRVGDRPMSESRRSAASPSWISRASCPVPYCTMLAADMGARVIKIEHPRSRRRHARLGPAVHRGRERVFPQRQSQQGKRRDRLQDRGAAARVLDALVARADVLVENFRPGTLDGLGLEYDDACGPPSATRSTCSMSGFGQTGPRRDEAGYDAVAQAEGGLMSVTGHAPTDRRFDSACHRRHRRGHVRVPGTAAGAASPREHRSRAVGRRGPARHGRGAALFPGGARTSRRASTRRDRQSAHRRSRRTTRSMPPTASSCSPSATTVSGSKFCDGSGSTRSRRQGVRDQRGPRAGI